MKITLINTPNPKLNATQQVLANRGVNIEDIYHYLNTTDDDINKPEMFGQQCLNDAATTIIQTIAAGLKILVIVDCDCDGFTSAALLINYLHDLCPSYIETGLKW